MQGDGFAGERQGAGSGGCWWEWKEVATSSKQFSISWWELFVHNWQIVFSGGCDLMERGLFLNAVGSLEFAELSWERRNESEG